MSEEKKPTPSTNFPVLSLRKSEQKTIENEEFLGDNRWKRANIELNNCQLQEVLLIFEIKVFWSVRSAFKSTEPNQNWVNKNLKVLTR